MPGNEARLAKQAIKIQGKPNLEFLISYHCNDGTLLLALFPGSLLEERTWYIYQFDKVANTN